MSQKMFLRARRTTASSSRGAGKPDNDHASRKTMTEQRVISECMTGLRFLRFFPVVLQAHPAQKMFLRARWTTASSNRGAGKPDNDHATRKTMTEQRVMSECMTGLRFLRFCPVVLLAHRAQEMLLRARRTTASSSRSADALHPHHATPQATPHTTF